MDFPERVWLEATPDAHDPNEVEDYRVHFQPCGCGEVSTPERSLTITASMPLPPWVLFSRRLWGSNVSHLTAEQQRLLAQRILIRLLLYPMAVLGPAAFVAGLLCGGR